MTRLLGLDLGGTNVKSVVLDVGGAAGPVIVRSSTEPTGAEAGPDAVAGVMIAAGRALVGRDASVGAAGVGVPGLFDFATGEVVFFTNLPGPWEGYPLRARLAEGLGMPVTLINDARAFTLAEWQAGAGRGCRTLACITVGTGVGGGLVIGGKLHFGAFGIAGELGHQTVLPGGPVCGCGNPGCMEAITRAPAIAAAADRDTFEQVLAGVAAGDLRCVAALEAAVEHFATGLANVVTTIGPEKIVVGGGAADRALVDRIRDAVRSKVTLVPPDQVQVVPAALGAEAGAVGSALAALGSPVGDAEFLVGEIPSAIRRRGRGQG